MRGLVYMKHWIVFLLSWLTVTSALRAEEGEYNKGIPIANIDGGADSLVAGCVNVITGDYLTSEQDIVLAGPEPLVFQRLYASSDYATDLLYDGWRHNHDSSVNMAPVKSHYRAFYTEKSGRRGFYRGKSEHHQAQLFFQSINGFSNSGSNYSAKTHPKNNVIQFHTKNNKTLEVITGGGIQRTFERFSVEKGENHYHLKTEAKPNGNRLHYFYDKHDQLIQVAAANAADSRFSWVKLEYPPKDDFKENPLFVLTASDGRKVTYHLQKFQRTKKEKRKRIDSRYHIVEVKSNHAPLVQYNYIYKKGLHNELLSHKKLPGGRFQEIEYYGEGVNKVKNFEVRLWAKDPRINRVMLLRAPVGNDSTPVITHRFKHIPYWKTPKNCSLKLLNGFTEVFDAYDHKTIYSYTKEQRLSIIRKYAGTGANPYELYSVERFVWDSDGKLRLKSLKDGKGKALSVHILTYDSYGNIARETFFGNISEKRPFNIKRKRCSCSKRIRSLYKMV